MHIPDGFLDAKTAVATAALAVTGMGIALAQAQRQLPRRKIPLLGVTAAFIFAAQMVNFPVLPGVSGHLLGATLAAVLLGPGGAVVALTGVVVVQCFLLQDGGLTALGANLFNMAVTGPVTGYAVYRWTRRWGAVRAAAVAGVCSTVVTAICCGAELAWSGAAPWRLVLPAMAGIHAVIGLGEGVITALVLGAIARTRPELIETDDAPPARALALGFVVAAGLMWFVSPFACRWPDGLEKVAATLGFEHKAVP